MGDGIEQQPTRRPTPLGYLTGVVFLSCLIAVMIMGTVKIAVGWFG